MNKKTLHPTIALAIQSMCDQYSDCVMEILDIVAMKALEHEVDKAALYLSSLISDITSKTLEVKNREISQRYTGQEFTLLGLEILTGNRQTETAKMARMSLTVADCAAFVGQNPFDSRLYCKDAKNGPRIAKNVREVYEYLRDGGDVERLISGFPERKLFVEKMMAYYKEREK